MTGASWQETRLPDDKILIPGGLDIPARGQRHGDRPPAFAPGGAAPAAAATRGSSDTGAAAGKGAEAAIAAGDYPLAVDDVDKAADPFGHEFGMLDVIGRGVDPTPIRNITKLRVRAETGR
jgi:hypothetical protein